MTMTHWRTISRAHQNGRHLQRGTGDAALALLALMILRRLLVLPQKMAMCTAAGNILHLVSALYSRECSKQHGTEWDVPWKGLVWVRHRF